MSTPSPPPQRIGLPWPELNVGLAYKDVISSSDSGKYSKILIFCCCWFGSFLKLWNLFDTELTTVSDFYFTKYKSSAPLLGFLLFFFVYNIVFTFHSPNHLSFTRWIQRIQNGQVCSLLSHNFSLDSGEFVISFLVYDVLQIQIDGEVVKDPNTLLRFLFLHWFEHL